MNEAIFLGGCPIIRPEGIYYEGRKVIALAGVGVGDVGGAVGGADTSARPTTGRPFRVSCSECRRVIFGPMRRGSRRSRQRDSPP